MKAIKVIEPFKVEIVDVPTTTHLSNVYSHRGHIHVLFIVLFSHPRSQALNGASHIKLDSVAV